MEYELTQLLGWTRRHAGDTIKSVNESVVSDGTAKITLNNDGYILVTKVLVDSEEIESTDYTVDGNVLTFSSNIEEGSDVTVFYNNARYTDEEVKAFITDAARGVAADMKFRWRLDMDAFKLIDDRFQLFRADDSSVIDQVEQLLVYRAGAFIYADKSNQAADDAIKIRDGETTIDTSTTAGSSEKALSRLIGLYKSAVLTARSEGFMGSAAHQELPSTQNPLEDRRWL